MVCRIATAVLSAALLTGAAAAQELPNVLASQEGYVQNWPLPANAGDLAAATGDEAVSGDQSIGPSARRAFLFSALVPGTGQYYAGSKKKAVVFLGVEVAAASMYFVWTGKGNDLEDDFRAVADAHWSAENYLAWRSTTKAIRNNSFTHAMPCSTEVVNGEFGKCGGNEKQQYYELLGKYDQFVAGWDDLTFAQTGNLVQHYTDIDSVESVISDLRLDYEEQRDDSNRYLKRATNLSGLILINHALSAIDAARTARQRARGVDQAAIDRRTRFVFTLHPGSNGEVPMLLAVRPFD